LAAAQQAGLFQLTGVDISERQLAIAMKNLPDAITLVQEEATAVLKRNAHSFDAVFCTDLLEHMETDDEMLEFLEVAKESLLPGGLMICQVPNMANLMSMQLFYIDVTHSCRFTDLSLLQLLECTGFRECQIIKRKAADSTQWVRMSVENCVHWAIYRICGVGDERHFPENPHRGGQGIVS
jgi:predicted TPR repeat methyltransferase